MTSSRNGFVHLHTHTEYSMLDGAARINDLVRIAKADGQIGIGITDHGNMYGVLDFYKACRANDIKPIIGIEAYMAKDSRFEKPQRKPRSELMDDSADGGKLYYHMTLLAENNEGYKNLMKLSSKSYLEGYYYKPRLDFEVLSQYSKGIIATSGCLGGLVLQSLLVGDSESAKKYATTFQDIFGRENFFIEIQDHGIDKQKQTNPQLIELARKIGAPLVATNDSHYCRREDSSSHDALLCVQTASFISDTNRLKFDGSEHYLKSNDEMRELFAEVPDACDNTLVIADRASVEIEFGRANLPHFKVPSNFVLGDQSESEKSYLRHLVFEGARARYGDSVPEEVVSRLDYELSVIESMGFSSYFLIVWDLIRFARESKIRIGPGRGSAAGCCVAYCLEIVDIDPIRHGLFFERFLNPGRKQMPDIDMDIDDRYRSDMIKYASSVYGEDHVAQIITFSTIKARAAVRDAARVLGFPYFLGDKIAKLMPPVVMGRDTPLWACFEEVPEHIDGYKAAKDLRNLYETDSEAKQVIEVAKGLEGLCRQDGIHAAAVVISGEELTEYLPIQRKPDSSQDASSAPIVTQYEMHGVEELGLLKMDFLGLKRKDKESGMTSLFDDPEMSGSIMDVSVEIPDIEFDRRTLLNFEKETLGRFVSDHPLLGYEEALKNLGATPIENFKVTDESDAVMGSASSYTNMATVAGLVTSIEKRTTKKGDQMANIALEDLTGSIEVAVIPKYYTKFSEILTPDAVLLITGRLDSQDREAKLVANEISSVDISRLTMGRLPVRLKLPCKFMTRKRLDVLKNILTEHKGDTPVNLIIERQTWRLPADYWVSLDSNLFSELRVNFGDAVISS